jgi:hypothetical protein
MASKKNITGVKNKRSYNDPRVAVFKQYFLDPKSPTFMNTLQSGIRAGYSQQYSESIGAQQARWYVEMLESTEGMRAQLLASAEKALVEATQYDARNKDYAALKLKASTFVSERLGKDAYSARQELTGAGGKRLFDDEKRERAKMPLTALFKTEDTPK